MDFITSYGSFTGYSTLSLSIILVLLTLLVAKKLSTQSSNNTGKVVSLSISKEHTFSKHQKESINLLTGLGIEGDCHAGEYVQHRHRLAIRPRPPNLRQVHLIDAEFLDDLKSKGHIVRPGDIGENITTRGLDLLSLSVGAKLHFIREGRQSNPVLSITGLRNPCPQIENFQAGLQEHCITRDINRRITKRKSGIMAIVEKGGEIRNGDVIRVEHPINHIIMDVV